MQLLIKMLYGVQYKGWHAYTLHPWFILELLCKWYGIDLQRDKLNMPENLGVYQKALEIWDSNDELAVQNAVNQLAEFHIKESDEYSRTDEYGNEEDSDFCSANYFVFAVEIVVWLAIRKKLGLKAYVPGHELMKLEINQLPRLAVEYPRIELVELCKAKIRADNPEIEFEI